MNRVAVFLSLVLFTSACLPWDQGGRRQLVQAKCENGSCSGLWEESTEWSVVFPATAIEALAEIDPADVWPCEPDPDVDLCVEVDGNGHVGCFRVYDVDTRQFAVAVAPSCALDEVESPLDWIDVGVGMVASVSQ